MYSLQCSNPLYGTTENPHKRGREAGGSSGGEVDNVWHSPFKILHLTFNIWPETFKIWHLIFVMIDQMFCLGSTGWRGRLYNGTRLWHWWKVTHNFPHGQANAFALQFMLYWKWTNWNDRIFVYSLRNPPAFCGAFSLKPTVGRHISQVRLRINFIFSLLK